jgi:hypothetical protein
MLKVEVLKTSKAPRSLERVAEVWREMDALEDGMDDADLEDAVELYKRSVQDAT